MVLHLAQDTLDNMLKNAYILSKNIERLQYEGEVPTDLGVYEKPHSHAFYGGVLVWSKEKGEFSKDFKDLTDFEEWGGIYVPEKGGLLIEGEL